MPPSESREACKRICKQCNAVFYVVKPSRKDKYCSRKCFFDFCRGKERPVMKGRAAWNSGLTSASDGRIARIAAVRQKNVVDRGTLFDLYVTQDLSMKVIGKRFGVTRHVIKRLAAEYGLKRISRPLDDLKPEMLRSLYEEGCSFREIGEMFSVSSTTIEARAHDWGIEPRRHRARVAPDPDLLKRLYWDEWLSYEEIAAQLGVDFTTIPYWLKKFNIPRRKAWETRRGADWEEPDIEAVIHLYEAEMLGMESIGKLFNTSRTNIGAILLNAGIALRKSGYPNISHYTTKDGHRVKSGLEMQVDDWLSSHSIPHTYEPPIGNTRYKADFLVNDTYIEIWGMTGHQRYDEKRQKKLAVYADLGLNLISLLPSDFPHLLPLAVLLEYLL